MLVVARILLLPPSNFVLSNIPLFVVPNCLSISKVKVLIFFDFPLLTFSSVLKC